MPGSLNQFVLVSARKSRGGDWWSPDDYDVRDRHGKVVGRNPAVSSQSRIFSDTRTSDGGF
jgi:hypothetical protein